jgi:hypothetical protein
MDNSKLLKKLLALRNATKASLEAYDDLIEELNKQSEPPKPRQRRNLKEDRIAKYEKYAVTGKLK